MTLQSFSIIPCSNKRLLKSACSKKNKYWIYMSQDSCFKYVTWITYMLIFTNSRCYSNICYMKIRRHRFFWSYFIRSYFKKIVAKVLVAEHEHFSENAIAMTLLNKALFTQTYENYQNNYSAYVLFNFSDNKCLENMLNFALRYLIC